MSIKKIVLFAVPVLVVIAAAVLIAWKTRTPFAQKYAHAVSQVDRGQCREALPVLDRARTEFKGMPGFADALYQYARCKSALDPQDAACWEAVVDVHTSRTVLADARLKVAMLSPNRDAALEAFAKDFPERPEARAVLVETGNKALAAKDMPKATEAWQKLVDTQPDSPEAVTALDQLGKLNLQTLCSKQPLPFITNHTVVSGENPILIARKHTTSAESIMRINGMTKPTILRGATLRIDLSRYCAVVDISNHDLQLFRIWNGTTNFVKRYSVGTGKEDNTPRGDFKITSREKDPTWYRPGSTPVPFGSKENLLGTRWMAIDKPGYGIHGTWEPDTVGKSSSAGCIRMLNEDVEELFDLICIGTPVLIKD